MNYGMCSGYELFRIVKFNTNFGIKLQDIETFDLDSKYGGLPMVFLQVYCRNKNKKVAMFVKLVNIFFAPTVFIELFNVSS